jgi:hypothetical protein
MAAAVFAAVFIALYVAHSVGDHWVQTSHQSAHKGRPGWVGRLADARHVATLTATKVAVLLPVAWLLDLHLSALGTVAASPSTRPRTGGPTGAPRSRGWPR